MSMKAGLSSASVGSLRHVHLRAQKPGSPAGERDPRGAEGRIGATSTKRPGLGRVRRICSVLERVPVSLYRLGREDELTHIDMSRYGRSSGSGLARPTDHSKQGLRRRQVDSRTAGAATLFPVAIPGQMTPYRAAISDTDRAQKEKEPRGRSV